MLIVHFLTISIVLAVQTKFCIPNNLCVYLSDGILTIHSAAKGWTSIGTGARMKGSKMLIGYLKEEKVMTSVGHSTGHYQPTFNALAPVLKLQVPKPAWAALAFSVASPVSGQEYIWATSNDPPIDAGKVIQIKRHLGCGKFKLQ